MSLFCRRCCAKLLRQVTGSMLTGVMYVVCENLQNRIKIRSMFQLNHIFCFPDFMCEVVIDDYFSFAPICLLHSNQEQHGPLEVVYETQSQNSYKQN